MPIHDDLTDREEHGGCTVYLARNILDRHPDYMPNIREWVEMSPREKTCAGPSGDRTMGISMDTSGAGNFADRASMAARAIAAVKNHTFWENYGERESDNGFVGFDWRTDDVFFIFKLSNNGTTFIVEA
jgi:hypothetical protein